MKIEELIEITDKVDGILYDYGYSVDHDLLSHYIFRVVKDSYPDSDIQPDGSDLRPILVVFRLRPLPEIV